jgi:hypothetical protein
MRHTRWITIAGIAFALAGMSRPACARRASHYLQMRHHVHASAGHVGWRHSRIVGNRRTHFYRVLAYRSQWPPSRDRIYFQTVAQARAAGYRQAAQGPIPVPAPLTWRGTRHQLPSLGKHRVAPQSPHDMEKPVAPPREEQPPVTPTNPMPN